ncbi:MAG TPA: methylmalonyl Co-A mutase-associated GTPase MeaB, partial [Thermoanaerobaculia bacterium]|nr:methylmalonyl Co-A mutase-associated GTPase MeaB [Thermoanaerobaculia bacterium]
KADREGVDRAAKDLEMMLSLGEHAGPGDWLPPILKTVAARDEGIDQVLAAAERHRDHLTAAGGLEGRRRAHLRLRVETILKERIVAAADRVLGVEREVERGFEQRSDPYQVAERLFSGVLHSESDPAGALEERAP